MKKQLLVIGALFLSVASINAQTNYQLPTRLKSNLYGNTATRAVEGTLTCNTMYVAGTTMDLDFTLNLSNADFEYGDSVSITFPAGFTVNSTTTDPIGAPTEGQDPEALNGIFGQTITWGDNDNNYGGVEPGSDIAVTINVTIDAGVTGAQVGDLFVSGDGYGGAPADLTANFTMNEYVVGDDAELVEGWVEGTSCGNTTLPIVILIHNNGVSDISNFDVSYAINGGTAVVETVTATIPVGDTLEYTFTTEGDFSAEGTYDLDFSTLLAGDIDANNDNGTGYFENTIPVELTDMTEAMPYNISFEIANNFEEYLGLGIENDPATAAGWAYSTTEFNTGANSLVLTAATDTTDAWIFLKCMNITAGDTYRVSYYSKTTAGYNGGIEIAAGVAQGIANMLVPVKAYTANVPGTTFVKDSTDMIAAASGTIYFGVRAAGSGAGSGSQTYLDDFSVYKVVDDAGVNSNEIVVSSFPNPTSNELTIQLNTVATEVSIITLDGKVISTTQANNSTVTLNVSSLSTGVYFYEVKTANGSIARNTFLKK
jgi:hypothetical protein